MNNYFRITGYDPKHDFSFILDCHGMFEKKWQFSSYLVQRGLKVLDIVDVTNTTEYPFAPEDREHLFLRASGSGNPPYHNTHC